MASTPVAMAALPSQRDLLQRLNDYRHFDEGRQTEIEFLIQSCIKLNNTCSTLESDLDDERNTRRTWKKRAEDAEAAVARKYTVVLVDGDGFIFRKAFFDALAMSGGSKAANELYNQVISHLKAADALSGINPDCDVLLNIYANKQGLAKTLAAAGYLSHPSHIDPFFCSFTQSRSLFQFIDCGPGKERVDAKLRDTFRFYANNAQCQRLYLACSHDNGYIAEFDKYRHDPVASKIVLVHGAQTAAAARAYSALPFKSTRFDNVFESSILEIPLKSEPIYVPPAPEALSLVSSFTENGSSDLTPANSRSSFSSNSVPQASTPLAALPLNTNTRTPSQPKASTPPTEVAKPKPATQAHAALINGMQDGKSGIPVNRLGQRIDLKMRIPTTAEMEKFEDRIARRKLCNEHHLRDNCESYNCRYDHEPIDAAMKNTLRYKARSIACTQGSKCRRMDCVYGHQCPWGNNNCGNPKCSFLKAGLHDIRDLEIAKFVAAAPNY
ncbi:uncharacterized protein Z520_07047 [Fonsecaea multimorphosa CBS 102226]|uniref:C3H1-type domain-containing protein n=1 Tax=Fonsecaea multimorphosa CBS 102226 TaxID=1442371 RepID=A0A0D2KK35_9EURO|nr:uncharacterized protein Z520_07047 [Fonsecaea multimorphosa CBS 102226]KIX96933.1 hypothetical protein Z520_07047 [Fonsecaea multimorphosa CBS 102226]OAL23130.1 hypothetical protein AYO22_06623 [Fonsecaea multimorphosa]